MFSLLPGIGRARYRYIVVDQTFTSGGVDCVHILIHRSSPCKFFSKLGS